MISFSSAEKLLLLVWGGPQELKMAILLGFSLAVIFCVFVSLSCYMDQHQYNSLFGAGGLFSWFLV